MVVAAKARRMKILPAVKPVARAKGIRVAVHEADRISLGSRRGLPRQPSAAGFTGNSESIRNPLARAAGFTATERRGVPRATEGMGVLP